MESTDPGNKTGTFCMIDLHKKQGVVHSHKTSVENRSLLLSIFTRSVETIQHYSAYFRAACFCVRRAAHCLRFFFGRGAWCVLGVRVGVGVWHRTGGKRLSIGIGERWEGGVGKPSYRVWFRRGARNLWRSTGTIFFFA